MLLFPKKTKFIKNYSRKKVKATYKQPDIPNLGDFCVIAKDAGRLTVFQIDSLRRLLRRKLRKHAKFWLRVFPSVPITKKPVGARLGKGKGPVKYWSCSIRPGQILVEVKGCTKLLAFGSFSALSRKLPIKTIFFCKSARWVL
jgi:large subunit ribosomal protein L16